MGTRNGVVDCQRSRWWWRWPFFFIRTITMNGFIGCACVSFCSLGSSREHRHFDDLMSRGQLDDNANQNEFISNSMSSRKSNFLLFFATRHTLRNWNDNIKQKRNNFFFAKFLLHALEWGHRRRRQTQMDKGRKVIGHIQKFYQLHNAATIAINWHYK